MADPHAGAPNGRTAESSGSRLSDRLYSQSACELYSPCPALPGFAAGLGCQRSCCGRQRHAASSMRRKVGEVAELLSRAFPVLQSHFVLQCVVVSLPPGCHGRSRGPAVAALLTPKILRAWTGPPCPCPPNFCPPTRLIHEATKPKHSSCCLPAPWPAPTAPAPSHCRARSHPVRGSLRGAVPPTGPRCAALCRAPSPSAGALVLQARPNWPLPCALRRVCERCASTRVRVRAACRGVRMAVGTPVGGMTAC